MESSRCQAIFFIAKAVSVDCTGLFVVCAALSAIEEICLGLLVIWTVRGVSIAS